MIKLASNTECTGCSSCYNCCPRSAISMIEDSEGFLLPQIDTDLCIECGLCEKRCPVLHPLNTDNHGQKAYAVINNLDRQKSSSGGAFSLFARYVLKYGGVVFGVTIDENLQVFHKKIDKVEELENLRGSKYVQSVIGRVYHDVKQELYGGKKVLFCGTPCQVAGLYAFLGNRHEEKLITLDFVCHGVPNQCVFDAYLKKIKKSKRLLVQGNIVGFRFRKLDCWDYRPAVKFSKSSWQMLIQEDNVYMSAFFRGLTYRECCFRCKYANLNRVGDFTIADFWGIGRHGRTFKKNVASGVSLVLDNRDKLPSFISEFKKYAYIEERDIFEAVEENGSLKCPVKRSEKRNSSVKDMLDENMSLYDYAIKYNLMKKENIIYYISTYLKNLIYTLGLYNVYKTISYKFGK